MGRNRGKVENHEKSHYYMITKVNMYSDKLNVQILVSLLIEHQISHIVLCPGSRNSPLTHTISQHPFFKCFSIFDERSAAFFAIGLSQKLQRPTAICCTSGTALLNLASAVAEAKYQQIPLLVISADRPPAWINQMDGQTIPQQGIFGSLVKKSVQLPEIQNDEDRWYCERLVNEAILSLSQHECAPVHINIPISEPLFQYTASKLPAVKAIKLAFTQRTICDPEFVQNWGKSQKRMILVGQLPPNPQLERIIEQISRQWHCVVLCEHLANIQNVNDVITHFDTILKVSDSSKIHQLKPDILLTIGGHIVSKQLKKFLRNARPVHYLISESGEPADTFQSLRSIVEGEPKRILKTLCESIPDVNNETEAIAYKTQWNSLQDIQIKKITNTTVPWSDLFVIRLFFDNMSSNAALHLANSSTVRYAQLFDLPPNTQVYCNRGTSGIDGTLSTSVGFSILHQGITYVIIGDLSFFYDMNVLMCRYITSNLRILLINNGGGGIFHQLQGLEKSPALAEYIAASHSVSAQGWIESLGIGYLAAKTETELQQCLIPFTQTKAEKTALCLEVFTDSQSNEKAIKTFYEILENKIHE